MDPYQRVHRQPVKVAPEGLSLLDPRIALGHVVAPTPEGFLASGARYVVVHVDLRSETQSVPSPDARVPRGLIGSDKFWRRVRGLGVDMVMQLRAEWGEPIFRDRSVVVWDLRPPPDEA